jgi:hypothetical protein
MKTINEQKAAILGISPAEYLTEQYKNVLNDNQALVCCINNEATKNLGYLLGVATQNEKGYIPTFIILETHNYELANTWVQKANEMIFDRDPKESAKIVFSSMF